MLAARRKGMRPKASLGRTSTLFLKNSSCSLASSSDCERLVDVAIRVTAEL